MSLKVRLVKAVAKAAVFFGAAIMFIIIDIKIDNNDAIACTVFNQQITLTVPTL